MPEIPPETVSERLERGDDDLTVLDIRPADAFEEWHVPGSVHVDVYDELGDDPDAAKDALDDLPRDDEIVTVCGAGKRSAVATDVLREMGYEATTLVDGLRGWGRVHRTASIPLDGGELLQVARPGTGCLSYVLVSDGAAAVVDPSQYTGRYEELLAERDATLSAVLETHGHADHVSGASDLAAAHDVPYYLHPGDAGDLTETTALASGQRVDVGSVELRVVHTPGHTPGSVAFDVEGQALLTGDTLFLESVGRPDLGGDDEGAVRERAAALYDSLRRLLEESDDAFVLPAHDPGAPAPPTTARLREVRERNTLLRHAREAFVDVVATDVPETPPNHERIKGANVGTETLPPEDARRLELGPNQCAAE